MDNIANQATLLYNNMTTNSNTVTTQILSLYDLTATKEALLDTYTPNQTITYVTRVENTWSASLYNLTVALGFGVTATIGPVVDPPLAVIVCVFVSTSGLVVGVVVSKIIQIFLPLIM